MSKQGRKRNLSLSQASESKPKRRRNAPASSAPDPEDVIVIDSDLESESDDLKAILAQIKAQEESERLAHRMQYEFDQPSTSGSKDTESHLEDDEAMAKRLAEEWAQEDETTNLEKPVDEFRMDMSDIEAVHPGPSYDALTSSSSHSQANVEKMSNHPEAPGCFTPLSCRVTCKGPSKNNNCAMTQCCAESRAIAIFEVLGAFDRQFLGERAIANSRALATVASAPKGNSVGPGGTGYGTDGHTAYKRSGSKADATTDKPNASASRWEKMAVHALATLTELLPAPYTDNPQVYDMLPHASIGHLLSLSQIPVLLADLLRNDSVIDWISRKEIYNAMLSLLRRMADSELTIQCLIRQRWEMDKSCDLENWMWEDGEITWNKTIKGDIEVAPPLYSHFKKLTKQSEAFLGGAMQVLGGEGEDGDVEDTMIQGASLCGDIIAARDALGRAITLLGLSSSNLETDNRATQEARLSDKGKGKGGFINIDKVYVDACEQLAFRHVSLWEASSKSDAGLSYINHNYAHQLAQTQNATRLPKSRLHLVKELAVTATSLPVGVWVRVDDVRNDAIKVMIAGPDGTPYAGGLFEFDCFMPIEYPNSPPLVHLKTTGGGSVRFNPNLYNDGKVCLSLLGTWPGRPEEQWSPRSTLLQVLVSIQSMILIDAPYYNEPGYGQANLKAPASIAYNRNISLQTTRWAIVDWLRDEHRHGIWREVIASHFSIYKDKIRQQILDWCKDDKQIRSYFTPTKPYTSYPQQGVQAARKTSNGLDLLEEFDKGMKVIESWKVGDEAEEYAIDKA
ncbi:hypothetical protein BYT27DRAFT_7242326 [Phlegmacium glaucopus]|nr:hypothetical protein BYT27DRAFT_7242326 [Phlegmacium glaucopus]